MQHECMMRGSHAFSAHSLAGRPALVRVMVGATARQSGSTLGAEAVIVPMINTVAEAKAFVGAKPADRQPELSPPARSIFGIDPPTQLKIRPAHVPSLAIGRGRRARRADDIRR
jgi:hypothetical protein